MNRDLDAVLPAIDRLLQQRVAPAVHRSRRPLAVDAWHVPGEPVAFPEAISQMFEPFAVGTAWGRPWGTVWMHVTGQIPADWVADPAHPVELVVDLGFSSANPGFQAEGLAYRQDGTVLKAIQPRNRHVPLDGAPGEDIDLYIEAAANPDVAADYSYAPTPLGTWETAGDEPLYVLRAVDVVQRDVEVWELQQDLVALRGIVDELPATLPRRAQILVALRRAVDVLDPDDIAGTAAKAREVLEPVLSAPAYASAHHIHAVGHAHIDSAWLWPLRETRRKVARTFSNALSLIESDPDVIFAASSAQQYQWLKEDKPELFDRVREQVAAGRFVPVGGMWVEPDLNLPSGESLVRQFLQGKSFFLREFGVEPQDAWVPDSFGYNAGFPQIAAEAGVRWFLTQKLSWNDTNRFPHHTFWWEGIDGTRLFTHFPPIDTYNAQLSAKEVHLAEAQYAEKGLANTSLAPFGWGDGGGGPTREMVAAARRWRDLEGSPRIELSSPERFFEAAQREYPDAPVWQGELYLELHRGVATTQAEIKRGNRIAERLLREAELWCAQATLRAGRPYPADVLAAAWQQVLLLQFHDILPGTSIAWVHADAHRMHAQVAAELRSLIEDAVRGILGAGDGSVRLNSGPRDQDGVPAGAASACASLEAVATAVPREGGGAVLDSRALHVEIDASGRLVSLVDTETGREFIAAGESGNDLHLLRDTPHQWDAWDIEADAPRSDVDVDARVHIAPGGRTVVVERSFLASRCVQQLSLAPDGTALDIRTSVDWHETEKLLKLAFPLAVQASQAESEIPFGHLSRPIHANTSWDTARYETVAHRWLRIADDVGGVALANDATYGYDIARIHGASGPFVRIRASLLRAPRFPDPESDRGTHAFSFSLRPAAQVGDAVGEGYRLNVPVRAVPGVRPGAIAPLLTSSNPAVVIEAVKLAEDGSGDLIVRLYEAHGGPAMSDVLFDLEVREVVVTDLLERPVEPRSSVQRIHGGARVELRPFQLTTLRVSHDGIARDLLPGEDER